MNRLRDGLRLIACILALAACPGEVIGSIPPAQFHFKNVVPLQPAEEPGGWKAAQVIITLGDRYGVAACKIEVGVPEWNVRGAVTDQVAQQAAAAAADQAARVVLGMGPSLSAIRCRRFIDEMHRLLRLAIPGASVTSFVTDGLKATTWP